MARHLKCRASSPSMDHAMDYLTFHSIDGAPPNTNPPPIGMCFLCSKVDFQSILSKSTSYCMMKTIERHQRCKYGALEKNQSPAEINKCCQDYIKLKAKAEILQCSQRHFLGENLSDPDTKNLEHLEKQLDVTMRKVRSTKVGCPSHLDCWAWVWGRLMVDQLMQLQRKEMLLESNRTLRNKLESWEAAATAAEEQNHDVQYNNEEATAGQLEFSGFYEPLHESNTSMSIGYNDGENNVASTSTQNVHGFLPSWML